MANNERFFLFILPQFDFSQRNFLRPFFTQPIILLNGKLFKILIQTAKLVNLEHNGIGNVKTMPLKRTLADFTGTKWLLSLVLLNKAKAVCCTTTSKHC